MKLQMTDINGEILEEKELTLREGDTLVMQFDHNNVNIELVSTVFETVEQALINDRELIAIPSCFELSVIKKSE